MSVYNFPRLFVEGFEGEEYAELEDEKVIFKRDKGRFGKVPYEIPLEELVDLIEEKTKRAFLIHIPNENKVIIVPKDTPVKILRASHLKVGTVVKEGDKIEVGDSYAFGLTSKGEVRRLRSLHSGVVVMVHWEPQGGRDIYHIIVAPEDKIKVLQL
ncbi:hypothetical protein IPA_00090 [Ignicoccus pacificus DSM 13166]|uniref:DUF2118 domain-containing protein n=1 Tax=Ignicoccus pacificus DSM 13166 TaxID=940294 RepID=A0A977KC77_9CREN|nr:hypothetical protein IPA_00090 [Ignicoccus pacificus DSM 13166]